MASHAGLPASTMRMGTGTVSMIMSVSTVEAMILGGLETSSHQNCLSRCQASDTPGVSLFPNSSHSEVYPCTLCAPTSSRSNPTSPSSSLVTLPSIPLSSLTASRSPCGERICGISTARSRPSPVGKFGAPPMAIRTTASRISTSGYVFSAEIWTLCEAQSTTSFRG